MHGRAFGAALLTVTVSGCASIWEGRTQDIAVSTDPPGAECGLYREEGQRIATIERTPGSTLVRKTRNDIWIVCVKPGYQQSIYYNRSGGTLTNVVAGVLTLGISTAVDASTGADNKYESPANVVMLPNQRGIAEGPAVLPQTFAANESDMGFGQGVIQRDRLQRRLLRLHITHLGRLEAIVGAGTVRIGEPGVSEGIVWVFCDCLLEQFDGLGQFRRLTLPPIVAAL